MIYLTLESEIFEKSMYDLETILFFLKNQTWKLTKIAKKICLLLIPLIAFYFTESK